MLNSNRFARWSLSRRANADAARTDDLPAAETRGLRNLHICFVAPYAWPVLSGDKSIEVVGGAEVQQCVLARLFVRAGYRVSMICADYGQKDVEEVAGVTVYKTCRPDAGLPVLRFLHPRLSSTWRALRAADADIYYQRSSAMLTGVVAEFCRRHGRRSIYAGASDVDFMPGKQPIRYRRDRWLFERGLAMVDRIVVQNETQQAGCLANYGRDSVLIPSCYEMPVAARPRIGDTVLWVGTIKDYKRPEMLLELARRMPSRRFVMIGGAGPDTGGDDSYFQGIKARALQLPNVEFKGFLPVAEADAYFDRARVVVNTSTYEGMPNTFMQAWARGVPTVATVDAGARWKGEPLYPVIQDMDQFAEALERMFTDEVHRARMAARCLDYFNATHGSATVLARYERVFEEVLRRTDDAGRR